ncbi:WhiB family transcriptional regulator [Gordonia terrae]|uniref:Transcriptional regulator n=1 Tax=Gordonia lacunae TaxID=417102 RepID=A0A243Q767_9ACTN|nr:WhiB family transcriptional regulator [Gordonia lacunae]OUC77286.1 transcriptional regulator [Gordonia lacunae]
MRGQTRREAGPIALLAEILRGTDSLTGAACIGSPELFDPRDPREDSDAAEYRHRAAAQLCARCPVFDACLAWSDSRSDQAHAVTAGRIPRAPGRPPKGGETAA